MRVALALVLVLGLVAAIAIGGCAKKKSTIILPGGKAKVEETGKDSSKVTVEGKDGQTMTMETKKNATVTEKDLGVPIYPGAEVGESGSWSMSGKEGSGSSEAYTLKSKDSFDKVYAFYKEKVKNSTMAMESKDADGKKTGMIQVASEDQKSVVTVGIKEVDGGTEISVTKIKQG